MPGCHAIKLKRTLLLAVALLILSGCGTRLVYENLDGLISWQVDDFVSLSDEQESVLEQKLAEHLQWHCTSELPHYVVWLRSVDKDLRSDISRALLDTRIAEFEARLDLLIRHVAPDIAEFSATLSDEQIGELFTNLEERGEDHREEFVDRSVEQLADDSARRILKQLKRWSGKLTEEQEQRVRDWSRARRPLGSGWLAQRGRRHAALRRLLEQREEPSFKQDFIDQMLDQKRFWSEAYAADIEHNKELTLRLAVDLHRLLTDKQRARLSKKINALASQFEGIECKAAGTTGS